MVNPKIPWSRREFPCNEYESCQIPETKTSVCFNCGYLRKKHKKIEKSWIDLKEVKPERGIEVIVKESDDSEYIVFLCNACGNCWRDSFSGGMLMIDPTHWRKSRRKND